MAKAERRADDSRRACACRLGLYCVAALLPLGGLGMRAYAGELAYGAGYGITHETNPTKSAVNLGSDYNHELIAGFAYRESTGSVNARLDAQAEARDYRRDTFPDDTFLYFDGVVVWSIVPKAFDWTIEDNREEARIDLTAVDTPSNRAVTNTFATGPDLTWRFTSATALKLGARYGQVDIEDLGGNRRAIGYARLEHLLSGASKLSLNYESSLIRFDPPSAVSEALRDDLYFRYESRPSPTDDLAMELGATRVSPDGEESPSRTRARLSFARALTPTSSINFSLADYVSDTYVDSLTKDTIALPPPSSNQSYRTKNAGIAYAVRSGAAGFSLSGYTQRVDYENPDDDYDEKSGRVSVTWQRTADWGFSANAYYVERQFPTLGREDVESIFFGDLTYQLTRKVRVVAGAAYERYETTPPGGPITNTTVSLGLSYSSDPRLYFAQSRR